MYFGFHCRYKYIYTCRIINLKCSPLSESIVQMFLICCCLFNILTYLLVKFPSFFHFYHCICQNKFLILYFDCHWIHSYWVILACNVMNYSIFPETLVLRTLENTWNFVIPIQVCSKVIGHSWSYRTLKEAQIIAVICDQ